MSDTKDQKWKVISSEYIFRRPWLTVRRDALQLPNGVVNPEYYILEYPTWVNTIAITRNGHFVMVRQYRPGLDDIFTELCAGVAEPGETPLEAAKRELLEETGYQGGIWQELTVLSSNPSTNNNLTHCFLATDVEPSDKRHLDPTEFLSVELKTEEEVLAMLMNDEIKQALMAAPLWKYFFHRSQR